MTQPDWNQVYIDVQTLKGDAHTLSIRVADLERLGLALLGSKIDDLSKRITALTSITIKLASLLTTQNDAELEALRQQLKTPTDVMKSDLAKATNSTD